MKVLVIDDDPDVLEAVSLLFEIQWSETETVTSMDGGTGITMAETENPDVVILDIGLPDLEGFEVCQAIRRFSRVPIVMLTVRDREEDIIKGFQVGADDYITKPFRHGELLARVKAVLRRAQMEPVMAGEQPFACGDLAIDFAGREVLVAGEAVKLTPTEYQLLYQLVKNTGRPLSERTLLERVWGPEYLEETNYLKAHVQTLRQKLGDDPEKPHLIVEEGAEGFKFVEPDKSADLS